MSTFRSIVFKCTLGDYAMKGSLSQISQTIASDQSWPFP